MNNLNSLVRNLRILGIGGALVANGTIVSTHGDAAFETAGGSNQTPGLNSRDNTRGWIFLPHLEPNQQLVVTAIGVFSLDGRPLVNSHTVGLWTASGALLGSATVPGGTAGTLAGEYRYASLSTAIPLPLGKGFVVGAHFAENDADDLLRPEAVQFASRISEPPAFGGVISLTGGLSFPSIPISRGSEGEPNYRFYEVNFQYEVIPEPSSTALFTLGFVALWFRRSSAPLATRG